MAAVLAARPAVASHFSAGWLWGILQTRPGTIHVTAPTPRRAKRKFIVHSAALRDVDIGAAAAIPVTAVARTALDLAGELSDRGIERLLDRADARKHFDLGAFEDVLSRNPRHLGAGKLRRAIGLYRPDPTLTRSGLERRFLELVKRAGLPLPSMNFSVAGLELDAYWEAERFAVELDVYETHGSPAAFERDRLREDELLMAGVELIRVTAPRLDREPAKTIYRVESHLQRRRRELGLN